MNQEDQINQLIKEKAFEKAFNLIVDEYQQRLYWHIRKMVTNHDDANDVLQDVFVKIWKALPKFKGDSKFSTWIYRVAYNTCLDRLKKNKRQQYTVEINEYTEHQVKTLDNALDKIEAKEREQTIQDCLALLPSEDSFLLTLYYFEELSLDDIGKIVDLKPNNVKVKLFRSRKKLATVLRKKLDNETIESYEGSYRAAFR